MPWSFPTRKGKVLVQLKAVCKKRELTVLVDEGVVLHGPEVVDVLPGGGDDPLAAVLDEVVQQEQRLVGPPPVCPVVLQHPLPEHTHGLWEGLVGEGERGHLLHLLARGTPGVVVSGVANLGLRLRVVHHDVGGLVHHLADLPHGDHGGG